MTRDWRKIRLWAIIFGWPAFLIQQVKKTTAGLILLTISGGLIGCLLPVEEGWPFIIALVVYLAGMTVLAFSRELSKFARLSQALDRGIYLVPGFIYVVLLRGFILLLS